MIDLDLFVKNNFPKIKEVGLAAGADEASVVAALKKYPMDMLEDIGEEGIVTFMLFEVPFSDAFLTDFEGIGYEEFLNKIQDISAGELSFVDVKDNVSEDTLEKGIGTSEVSFKCNGESFSYTAKVYYDWFDVKFISFLNTVLEKKGIEKRLIVFGDPNGTFITYKKPGFVKKFKEVFPMLKADIA
ncbi:hypothetical protein [Butyrivibrio sp. M55]|uniref:hypothetical protein n=1 Tax=Butyrivibrio sp. M55 TaxID=1855323 RepID=UPI0008E7BCDC|nr:hypothetical protein [Butyrivibrio sp. M55]SFU92659.1 hypothetical protein SAMN05216540_12215 [Butyrivibrio sp. M55]